MMKLTTSPTSPFVRKVRAVAIYAGLEERIESVRIPTIDPELLRYNPLGKIPALILDDGSTLVDSPVICEYLDSLHAKPKLHPAAGPARWTALKRQALADGVADAAVLLYVEKMRPMAQQSNESIEKQLGKITRTLAYFDGEVGTLGTGLDIGTVSIACGVGYAGLRLPTFGVDWRKANTALARWYDRMLDHPALGRTVPEPPPEPKPA